jgi:hypothetical protein
MSSGAVTLSTSLRPELGSDCLLDRADQCRRGAAHLGGGERANDAPCRPSPVQMPQRTNRTSHPKRVMEPGSRARGFLANLPQGKLNADVRSPVGLYKAAARMRIPRARVEVKPATELHGESSEDLRDRTKIDLAGVARGRAGTSRPPRGSPSRTLVSRPRPFDPESCDRPVPCLGRHEYGDDRDERHRDDVRRKRAASVWQQRRRNER